MNNVNKTLYIPLYGKSYVSRKGLFLDDKKAEEIWAAEGFSLKGKSASKWLAYYMGIRSAVFDEWLKQQMAENPGSVVIHIGCGMDSRILRVGSGNHKWYDVDFYDVIKARKQYYSESDTYKMISGDVRESKWLSEICESLKERGVRVMFSGVDEKVYKTLTKMHFVEKIGEENFHWDAVAAIKVIEKEVFIEN